MTEPVNPNESFFDLEHLEGRILQGVYEVGSRIGEGGMSWVYRAHHKILGNEVAIKVLRTTLEDEPLHYERFLREARVLYKLDHRHVVRIYQLIQTDELVGYVQEWCDGGNLKEWLEANSDVSSIDAIGLFFFPLLDAVGFTHSQGMIHRDLKPQNVLLAKRGDLLVPKLSDFGLVKDEDDEDLTETGTIMGTLHYMSPEQFEESKRVDARADLYSLGVMLYEMTTRRLPYTGRMPSLGLKILKGNPPPPKEAPLAVREVILRCMACEPDDRYASAEELKEALAAACEASFESFSFEEYSQVQKSRPLTGGRDKPVFSESDTTHSQPAIVPNEETHTFIEMQQDQSPQAFASTLSSPAFHTLESSETSKTNESSSKPETNNSATIITEPKITAYSAEKMPESLIEISPSMLSPSAPTTRKDPDPATRKDPVPARSAIRKFGWLRVFLVLVGGVCCGWFLAFSYKWVKKTKLIHSHQGKIKQTGVLSRSVKKKTPVRTVQSAKPSKASPKLRPKATHRATKKPKNKPSKPSFSPHPRLLFVPRKPYHR